MVLPVPPKVPITVRLDADVRERLRVLSDRTGIDMSIIAQLAITAALDSVAQAGGRLVVPLQFSVEHMPEKSPVTYPPHQESPLRLDSPVSTPNEPSKHHGPKPSQP